MRREIGYALALRKPVIPLIFEDALPPIPIINVTREDFTHTPWNRAFASLMARLHRIEDSAQQALSLPQDPYRDYLNTLYQDIIGYLRQTLFSEIALYSRSTPGAVRTRTIRALPLAFWHAVNATPESAAERKEDFASFREASSHYEGRVLLLGDPGAGKTTTLFAFARDKVAERLENPSLPLPVIARIATWDSAKRMPLSNWLAEQVPMLDPDALRRLCDSDSILLLLDGLDELGHEREDPQTKERYDPRRRFLNMLPDKGHVIVTCRAHEYDELGERLALRGAVTLSALTDSQIRDYLGDLPHLWSLLQSDADLMQVARNPLLLSLFAFAFSEMGEEGALVAQRFPDHHLRDMIFERYIQRRYEHEYLKRHVDFELSDIYSILGPAALASDLAGHVGDLTPILNLCVPQAHLQPVTDMANHLVDLHMLVRESSGGLRFTHLLLRDYFAGWARLHIPRWKEQMVDVVGQLRTAGALNLLTGWFADPDVGELAEKAAWRYFHDASGSLWSSVRIALDRWEEYKNRHGNVR